MENQNILNFVNQEEILALQKISNHSTNIDIERYIAVYGVNIMGGDVKRMVMNYKIIHITNGQLLNIEPVNKPVWVISDDHKVLVRNEQGQPILNPDYVPTYSEEVKDEEDNIVVEGGILLNGDEEYLTEKGFKYFKGIAWDVANPLSKKQQFEYYISMLDSEDNFFNFY